MFLKLTGTGSWNRVIVINLDKIKYFTICNDGTRFYIDGDDEPVDVTEDLAFIMYCLEKLTIDQRPARAFFKR